MKKGGILNKQLNEVLASLGHTDTIVVCDAGLPIPDEKQRVDLAFEPGTPGQLQVLSGLLRELVVEKVVLATETRDVSPEMHESLLALFEEHGIHEIEYVPHVQFKEKSTKSKAIIRTGEFTPYANVLLVCGCAY